MTRPRSTFAAAALGATFAVLACVNTVGLDGYHDAVQSICLCEEVRPSVFKSCEANLNAELDAATDEERDAWLKTVKRLGCDANDLSCADDGAYCFAELGQLCLDDGEPCEVSEQCCSFHEGLPKRGCVDGAGCGNCRTCSEYLVDPLALGPPMCVDSEKIRKALEDCAAANCDLVGLEACIKEQCEKQYEACENDARPQ